MSGTQFRPGTASEAGRRGGIRSGESRRQKAERRKYALHVVSDVVYAHYLRDAAVQEIRDFVAWQGQRKRKATLAKKYLADLKEGTSDDEYLRSLEDYYTEEWEHLTVMTGSRSDALRFSVMHLDDSIEAVRHDRTGQEELFEDLAEDVIRTLEAVDRKISDE